MLSFTQYLNESPTSLSQTAVHDRIHDKRSTVYGGRPPRPGEVNKLYHTTSHQAALKILKSGHIKTPHQVDPEYGHEVYGHDGGDGAHYVYAGTSKKASQYAAVSSGVTFEFHARGKERKTVVQPDVEGGLAMIHGGVPAHHITKIHFEGDHPLNAAIKKAHVDYIKANHG